MIVDRGAHRPEDPRAASCAEMLSSRGAEAVLMRATARTVALTGNAVCSSREPAVTTVPPASRAIQTASLA